MADQAHHLSPLDHGKASRPIVRPLPLEEAQGTTSSAGKHQASIRKVRRT